MTIEFTVSQSPFRFGLAEGIEPHQVTPGTLLTAENVAWSKAGKLGKRFGTTELPIGIIGGSTIPAGARLFSRGSELCLVDGNDLYSYSAPLGAWQRAGGMPNVGMTWKTLLDSSMGAGAADVALYASGTGGYLVHAWTIGAPQTSNAQAGLFVQVVDAVTGACVVAPTLLTSLASIATFGVRVLVLGTKAVVLTRGGASPTFGFQANVIDLTTMTIGIGTIIRGDGANRQGLGPWDACTADGSTFILAYNRNASTIALESFTSALVAVASGTVVDANGCQTVSIAGVTGEALYVLYTQGAASPAPVRLAVNNVSTLAAVVAPVTLDTPSASGVVINTGVCRFDAANCIASWNTQELSGVRMDSVKVSNAGVIDTQSRRTTYQSLFLLRPFMLGGRSYATSVSAVVGLSSGFTGWNSYLVEVETFTNLSTTGVPHRYLGTIDLLTGGLQPVAAPMPNGVPGLAPTTQVLVAVPYLATAAPNLTNWRQGSRLATLSVGASLPADMWRSFSAQESYSAGGYLTAYDGRRPFDFGFATTPVISALTTSAVGGLVLAGTYLYAVLQEYRSNAGILHRSPVSFSAPLTSAGTTSTNTITTAVFNVGAKQGPAPNFGSNAPVQTLLPVYRSTVNGSSYQRLTYEPGFNVISADASANTVLLNDRRADAGVDGAGTTLASRPVIYTAGGILDDFAPPANVTLCYHVDRVWVLAGDQRTWWYSKTFQDDLGTAPGFHPQLRISFADVQTAMASMDDKAIFFSASGVKYMLGTGPAPNGQNSDFQTPTTIQSDVGCTSARSVVTTPDGVMFLSDRGIYLLDRGLTLSWIGRPVKDTLAAYPTVTSAVLVAKQNQVRFTCNTAAGTSGITIVYDYVEKQWSTFKHWVNNVYGGPIADACTWNGAWTFLSASGLVYTESATSYLDGSRYVPMTIETAWMTANGPLAFQSVRSFNLHGYSNTDHDLTVQVGFDTVASYPQSVTFAATSPVTAVGSLDDCQISIGTRRKCNAIRFRVSDSTPSAGAVGSGQGPTFDMMALEVGVKRGTGNTPANKRG